MSKKLYLIIALVSISATAMSQRCKYTFKGVVKDFHDGTPLVGAALQIENSKKSTSTDLEGNFVFKNLCTTSFVVVVSHVSCETKKVTIDLTKNSFKEIRLEHHIEELTEVIVKTKNKTEATSIEQSLKKESIVEFTDKSLGDALNTISGVSSLNTGNTIVKPMIHGLHSSRLLIINNNVRMFDQEWGDEHAPNVDINAFDRIDVVKGANTLKYGSDAIGGAIITRLRKYVAKDSIFGSTTTSLNSNGLGGNINSEIIKTYTSGFYSRLQANYKKFGDFKAPDYHLTNTGIQNINASFRLGFNSYEKGFDAYYSFVNNKIGILRSSHIGNVNDLVSAIESPVPSIIEDFTYSIDVPNQKINHHLAKIEAFKRFKSFGKLTIQYDLQLNRRQEFDLRRGDLRDRPVIDLRLFTTSIQPDLEIDSFENLKINTGLLFRYQNNDPLVDIGAATLIPYFDKYEAGVYTIVNFDIDETSNMNVGVRYDFSKIESRKNYFLSDWSNLGYDVLFPQFDTGVIDGIELETRPEFTFHNISTSLGYEKEFENDFGVLFNYGLAQRMPNPSELFSGGLHHSAARIEIGFLTIGKETANKFALAFQRNNEDFGFSVNPYYKHIDGFVQLIPTGIRTTIRGAFPVWEYRQVNARIFGADFDINKKINDQFSYTGTLSLLKGDNLTDNIPLIHMPSTNFSNSITYKNEAFHQLKLSINQRTVFQQNQFPDYNFFTFNPTIQQQVFVDISSTPPTYNLFGFNSSAVFHPFKKGSMQVEFNIDNIFNVAYRENLNRLRYFADELGRNFNIKLKINY